MLHCFVKECISRWTQKYANPHESNKPYELNWTNIDVNHVSAVLKYVTVSFRSVKTSRLYLLWKQISSDFLYINFNVKKDDFPRNICQSYVFKVFCVFICTNLLVLNTEVKSYVYELSRDGANKPVLVSVLFYTDQQCIFTEIINPLSWVELKQK